MRRNKTLFGAVPTANLLMQVAMLLPLPAASSGGERAIALPNPE